jgi:hypothetical protein
LKIQTNVYIRECLQLFYREHFYPHILGRWVF